MRESLAIGAVLLFASIASAAAGGQPAVGGESSARVVSGGFLPLGFSAKAAVMLVEALRKHGFSEDQARAAEEICRRIQRNGHPAEAAVSKAYEGIGKKASPEAILHAMQRVSARFDYAYGRVDKLDLGPQRRQAANTLADALAAGLDPNDGDRLVETLETLGAGKALALAVIEASRDMARSGVSSRNTAEALEAAVRNRYDAPAVCRLRAALMARSWLEDPNELANRYQHAYRHGWDFGAGDPPGRSGDPAAPGGGGGGKTSGGAGGDGGGATAGGRSGSGGGPAGSAGGGGGRS